VRATLPKAAAADPKPARPGICWLRGPASRVGSEQIGEHGWRSRGRDEVLAGLNRSIGYLCFRDKKITFIARRWFVTMAHSSPYSDIKDATSRNGFFLDQISIEDVRGHKIVFDLFRAAPNRRQPPSPPPAALL
jgi:hypothetical protein